MFSFGEIDSPARGARDYGALPTGSSSSSSTSGRGRGNDLYGDDELDQEGFHESFDEVEYNSSLWATSPNPERKRALRRDFNDLDRSKSGSNTGGGGYILSRRTATLFAYVAAIAAVFAVLNQSSSSSSTPSIDIFKGVFTHHTDDDDDGSSAAKPNFIFFLADDLGWNSLGYDEGTDLDFATPFLSKMAASGIKLSNHYSQEVCTPARAALLTGRYPLSVGMQYNEVDVDEAWGLSLNETLLPEILQSEGYTTYALGKWNLGHFSPRYLPTSRGFDYFMGYLTGQTYHWSKKVPTYRNFRDLMYSDKDCYAPYNGSDEHKYSTHLYRDKAVDIINHHNFDKSPMFLYLAFQAVHDPFTDSGIYKNGIPVEYVGEDDYNYLQMHVKGRKRRQYGLALMLMDRAVSKIYHALESVGQEENTYFIFTSDNGGCFEAGGRNGPLRGTKGTLYEGGTKTDAFIYSPLIPENLHGSTYDGLMHISDWFPTILDFAGISYTPEDGYELDGVTQKVGFRYGAGENLRTEMLYNFYTKVASKSTFTIDLNAPVAYRNIQYKLIHSFEDSSYSDWYTSEQIVEDDGTFTSRTCSQSESLHGNYSKMLFDLQADPYETNNLYDDEDYATIKATFYVKLSELAATATMDLTKCVNCRSKEAEVKWKEAGGYIVPWADEKDVKHSIMPYADRSYPTFCTFTGSVVSPLEGDDDIDDDAFDDTFTDLDADDDWSGDDSTAEPSFLPSFPPTVSPTPTKKWESAEPTHKPTKLPTYEPSKKPTKRPTAVPTTHKPTYFDIGGTANPTSISFPPTESPQGNDDDDSSKGKDDDDNKGKDDDNKGKDDDNKGKDDDEDDKHDDKDDDNKGKDDDNKGKDDDNKGKDDDNKGKDDDKKGKDDDKKDKDDDGKGKDDDGKGKDDDGKGKDDDNVHKETRAPTPTKHTFNPTPSADVPDKM